MSRPIVFAALVATSAAFGAGDQYPGAKGSLSPDGSWLVSCVPAIEGRSHCLFITTGRVPKPKEAPLLGFERSCDVLWAPNSRRLALTDWGGSDFAQILVAEVGVAPMVRELDVSDVRRQMKPEELHGHCYFEAIRWGGSDSLEIHVFGHADEEPLQGFSYRFRISLSSGIAKILRQESQPNQSLEPTTTSVTPRADARVAPAAVAAHL